MLLTCKVSFWVTEMTRVVLKVDVNKWLISAPYGRKIWKLQFAATINLQVLQSFYAKFARITFGKFTMLPALGSSLQQRRLAEQNF